MRKLATFESYASWDGMIKEMSRKCGCPAAVFEEAYMRHRHKRDGTQEGSYQAVRGCMMELKERGYTYESNRE